VQGMTGVEPIVGCCSSGYAQVLLWRHATALTDLPPGPLAARRPAALSQHIVPAARVRVAGAPHACVALATLTAADAPPPRATLAGA